MKLRPALLWLLVMGIFALAFNACASGPTAQPATAAATASVAAKPAAVAPAPVVVAKVDYLTQVKPIFENYCYQCHGNGKSRAGFHLDQKAMVMKQIVAGDPARSYLYKAMTKSLGASDHMPPTNEDQPEESDLATIKLWIEQGANWPDGV